MIKQKKFFIKDLKKVVFLGVFENYKNLIDVNNSFGLETEIITSSNQSKLIPKNLNYKIFDTTKGPFEKFIKQTCKIEKTLFFSISARYIFKKDKIKKFFKNNLVNFHETRLPLDGGGAVFSWNIMREDKICNHVIHLINGGIDKGSILHSDKSLYPFSCKTPLDFKKVSDERFINCYEKFIKKLSSGKKLDLVVQNDGIGRYNPRINTIKNGLIDWDMEPHDLLNFINAFDDPYDGASTYIDNKKHGRLFLKKVQLHGGDSSNHPFMQGIISRHDGDWIVVSTKGKYMLLIEEVLDKNSKNILSQLKVGDRFFTPPDILRNAKSERVFYSAKGRKKLKKSIKRV